MSTRTVHQEYQNSIFKTALTYSSGVLGSDESITEARAWQRWVCRPQQALSIHRGRRLDVPLPHAYGLPVNWDSHKSKKFRERQANRWEELLTLRGFQLRLRRSVQRLWDRCQLDRNTRKQKLFRKEKSLQLWVIARDGGGLYQCLFLPANE